MGHSALVTGPRRLGDEKPPVHTTAKSRGIGALLGLSSEVLHPHRQSFHALIRP